ncbi:MAG: rpsF [Nitrospirae bacterium]|nr:rpsF [Nitrospirota bacterium]
MNLYEKIMILNPGLDTKAVEETVEKVKEKITKQGGEILKSENWGTRKLAYVLNKHDKGIYILLLFKSPPSTILELERFCKVTDTIIKFMVVRLQKKKQIEAVMASLTKAASEAAIKEASPVEEEKIPQNTESQEENISEEEDK